MGNINPVDGITLGLIGAGAVLFIIMAQQWGKKRKADAEGSVPVGYGAGEFWRPRDEEPPPPPPRRTEETAPPSVYILPLRFRVNLPDEPVPETFQRLEGGIKTLMVVPELHQDRLRGTYRVVLQRVNTAQAPPFGVLPVYTILASRDWEKNGYLEFDISGRRTLLTNLADGNNVVCLSVNGHRMEPNERREIKVGDWIRIGDSPRPTDYSKKRYRIDLQLMADTPANEG